MIFVNSFTSFPIVVGGTGDPNYANVTLLLHADNNNTDTSPIGATISPTGIVYNTSIKKFGSAAFSFNGISSSFVTPSNANYAFGSGDFTLECWVYFNSTTYPAQRVWTNNLAFGANSMYLTLNAGYAYFQVGGAGALQGATQGITTGVWYHIAITRSGNVWKQFVNGVLDGTATNSTNPDNGTSSQFYIGRGFNGSPNEYFDGLLDDFRITKGVARYTAGFPLPTAPFPDNGGTQSVEYPPQAMTSLNTPVISGQPYGNGTYTVSASSFLAATYEGWRAFSKNASQNFGWITPGNYNSPAGSYNTPTYTASATFSGTTYQGEWIQLSLPSPIVLTSYSLRTRQDGFWEQFPRTWHLGGSNDGTTFTLIESRTNQPAASSTTYQFTIVGNTTAYSHYRLITTFIQSSGYSNNSINQMRLFGY